MIARPEGVDVVAVPQPHIRHRPLRSAPRAQDRVGPREVAGPCQLDIVVRARGDGDGEAGAVGDLHVVGGAFGCRAMRGEDRGQPEALWRLGAEQPVARAHSGHAAVSPGPQRVGDGQGRGGRIRARPQRVKDARDYGGRHQRPRAVMDQDVGHARPFQQVEPGADAVRPRLAALDQRHPAAEFGDRAGHVVGVDHHDHAAHGRQRIDGAGQHRPSADKAPLLGLAPARAGTAPGGGDEGGGHEGKRCFGHQAMVMRWGPAPQSGRLPGDCRGAPAQRGGADHNH